MLNGEWEIIYDENNEGKKNKYHSNDGFNNGLIEKIYVPSVWERFKKDYEGVVYYRRKFKVSKYVKNIDGKMLDSVIDFFNYIIIPCIMIFWFKIVPLPFEIIIPVIILIISAISYSNLNLMTSENFYKGFPSLLLM